MNNVVQIVEMDQERDRKTCLSLDLRVTGANRELAQWIADHRGRYSAMEIARWLGCSDYRIKALRLWAEGGFKGAPTYNEKRKEQHHRRRAYDPALETNDNSESTTLVAKWPPMDDETKAKLRALPKKEKTSTYTPKTTGTRRELSL